MEENIKPKITAFTPDNNYKTTLVGKFSLTEQKGRELTWEEQLALQQAKAAFSTGDFLQTKEILEKAGFIVQLFGNQG